ncbi:Fe-S protein assembly co-chaperone HscB [Comamonadaceae bacterium SL12-8]|uniref:Fe-S protein assembly co-chaperone HscB n=1 Tax=Amphibiibacter pelophylacis TaxID=1799477 RepID=A0ACC6P2A2_9BURK
MDDDDFALLGLPRRHQIDEAALESAWRDWQSRVHPDRHVGQGDAGRRLAMQWSLRINEAHRRLKDPVQRGAYLCELRGQAVDAERNTAMPADFLMQQMQWREALDDADSVAALDALLAEAATQRHHWLERLQTALDVDGDTAAAAQAVRALMFVQRLRHEASARQAALDAAADLP